MKIGIITTTNESGHSYVSLGFAKALKDDFDISVLSTLGVKDNTYGAKIWQDFRVNLLPCSYLSLGSYWSEVKEWIEKEKIDTVLLNEWYDWDLAQRIKDEGVKVVCYVDWFSKDHIHFYENLCDATIVSAEHAFEVFLGHKNSNFVPWGIDTELFKPKQGKKSLFFHSAGWGGINNRKCTPAIIKAFYKLWKERDDVTMYLHTQKPWFNGVTVDRIKEMRGKGLRVKVGHVSHPGLYHKGKVYVGPSKLEGLGLYLPEALACGLPVITTDKPPMNQFVGEERGWLIDAVDEKQRDDGYYFPEYEIDEEQLYETMKSIADNQDVSDKSKKAREFIEKNHDFNKHFKPKVIEILKNVSSS